MYVGDPGHSRNSKIYLPRSSNFWTVCFYFQERLKGQSFIQWYPHAFGHAVYLSVPLTICLSVWDLSVCRSSSQQWETFTWRTVRVLLWSTPSQPSRPLTTCRTSESRSSEWRTRRMYDTHTHTHTWNTGLFRKSWCHFLFSSASLEQSLTQHENSDEWSWSDYFS